MIDSKILTREPPKNETPKRRGFLDLIAVSMAFYAMMITTPVGGLVARAYHKVMGEEVKTRPLMAYFETDGAKDSSLAIAISEPPKASSATSLIAKRVGLAPELARAVAVLAAGGKETADGHLDVQFSAAARSSFGAVGAEIPASNAPAEERERRMLEGIAKLRDRLGGDEAAVAALAVEFKHVLFAVERSKLSTGIGIDPTTYDKIRPYLPADQRSEADALVDGTFALMIAFDMTWPVGPDWPVSSKFGERDHPVLGKKSFHTGTDLAVPTGTEISSIAQGRVVYATEDSVNGRFVKIDHGHGLTSAYCHASELIVRRHEDVDKGRKVALSGSTGRSTGPHLHFQMELNGRPVNPELFKRTPQLAKASP